MNVLQAPWIGTMTPENAGTISELITQTLRKNLVSGIVFWTVDSVAPKLPMTIDIDTLKGIRIAQGPDNTVQMTLNFVLHTFVIPTLAETEPDPGTDALLPLVSVTDEKLTIVFRFP